MGGRFLKFRCGFWAELNVDADEDGFSMIRIEKEKEMIDLRVLILKGIEINWSLVCMLLC